MNGNKDTQQTGEYDDIIRLPHHVSVRHPRMSMLNRAAQFAPFAALTGFDAAIGESGRLTEEWTELGDYRLGNLNRKLQQLIRRLPAHPAATVTFFLPDSRKAGGSYQTHAGTVRRMDQTERVIEMDDGMKIAMDDIVDINVEGADEENNENKESKENEES